LIACLANNHQQNALTISKCTNTTNAGENKSIVSERREGY